MTNKKLNTEDNSFAWGTLVDLYSGASSEIQTLKAGDKLLSISIPGQIAKSDENWISFETSSIAGAQLIENTVLRIRHRDISEYYVINDSIKVTKNHCFFIKRNSIWGWKKAKDIQIDDVYLNETLTEKTISATEHIQGATPITVTTIKTDNNDSYIAGGAYNTSFTNMLIG